MSTPEHFVVEESLVGVEFRIVLRAHGNSPDEAVLAERLRARGLERPYLRSGSSGKEDLQWAESRACLLEAAELPLFRELSGNELALSVSHTRKASAAVVTFASKVAGVGIDLEDAERKVSDQALARFSPPAEQCFGLERIELWCVKEACYKSDPGNGVTKLRHYSIEAYDRATRIGRASRPDSGLPLAYRIFRWGAFTGAIALASPRD